MQKDNKCMECMKKMSKCTLHQDPFGCPDLEQMLQGYLKTLGQNQLEKPCFYSAWGQGSL